MNVFTAAPIVSLFGSHLPSSSVLMNPFSLSTGGLSPYQNTKKLRFDLTQEFSSLKLADDSVIFLEYARMPALTALSTCYKNIRLCNSENINVFDSCQGSVGNPILFTCESGNNATNNYILNTQYSRLTIPPHFLNNGYIEFEIDTILTAANNNTVFTQAQLNELILKVVIAEPDIELTQDINLAPEYKNAKDFFKIRTFNRSPLNH